MSEELVKALERIKKRNEDFVDDFMGEDNHKLPSDGDIARYNDWKDASKALAAHKAKALSQTVVQIEDKLTWSDVNNDDPILILADTLAFINHNSLGTIHEKLEAAKEAEIAFKRIRPRLELEQSALSEEELTDILSQAMDDRDAPKVPIVRTIIKALRDAGVLNVRESKLPLIIGDSIQNGNSQGNEDEAIFYR